MHVCCEKAIQTVLPSIEKQHLKTRFLRRAIKFFTDPTITWVTRTHSPWAPLGEALIALCEWMCKTQVVRCVFVACNHIVHVHMEACKNTARGAIRYIVRTQPAGDAAEENVRSIMKVHRCHRLHTEKEERVMLLLVSAYLVLDLQCMPRDVFILNSTAQHYQKCWQVYLFKI